MSYSISASQMESIRSAILEQALLYGDIFTNKLLSSLNERSKITYIAAAVTLFVTAKLYSTIAYPRNLRHIKRIPLIPWFASLMRQDTPVERTEEFIIPTWKETNGIVSIYDQFGWEVNVTNPEAIRTILHKTDLFPKNTELTRLNPKTLLRRFLGVSNLSFANAHEWRKLRKIANPAFHRSMPVKTFAYLTGQMFQQIDQADGPVPIQSLLQRFTLDAIGLAGFGFEFNAINTPDGEWTRVYNDVAEGIGDIPFFFFPVLDTTFLSLFPQRKEKHASLTKLNRLFHEVIEHKKEELTKARPNADDNEKDLLTLMIEAGSHEGDSTEPLTNEELRNQLVLFFLAGHDTTSNALTAALYFLAANPQLQDKARKEVLEILGDEKNDSWPNVEQLKEFKYLTLVMKEAVRLATPIQALIQREAAEDTELAGVLIPKDTLVRIDLLGIHYNPNLWQDPKVFNPDRYANGGEMESRSSTYSYLPFGGGARQCIGMNFSFAEQRVALSGILRRYELSIPEDSIHKDGLKFSSQLVLLTANDVRINFNRRY